MADLALTPAIAAARDKWRYRGDERPGFAEPVAAGEESVWDFPRPPRIEAVAQRMRVCASDTVVAETGQGVRVLETAGAPTYYFPPCDVDFGQLEREGEASLCEWKGVATTFSVAGHRGAAWTYERTFEEFAAIRGWLAFYPTVLDCYLDDERVTAQPGGYYGGWVTRRLRGPIKGGPGSGAW